MVRPAIPGVRSRNQKDGMVPTVRSHTGHTAGATPLVRRLFCCRVATYPRRDSNPLLAAKNGASYP